MSAPAATAKATATAKRRSGTATPITHMTSSAMCALMTLAVMLDAGGPVRPDAAGLRPTGQMESEPGSLAEYFDGWYADMTGSPVKDKIQQRHLGLPPHLLSTSLLGWDGIAEAIAELRLFPGAMLVDLACGRGGYGRPGSRPGRPTLCSASMQSTLPRSQTPPTTKSGGSQHLAAAWY